MTRFTTAFAQSQSALAYLIAAGDGGIATIPDAHVDASMAKL